MSLPNTFISRALGIDVKFENFNLGGAVYLPRRVVVIGQGSSSSTFDYDQTEILSSSQAGAKYGYGSPIHLAVNQLLPANNTGLLGIPVTVIPLADGTTSATGSITVTGTETVQSVGQIYIGGIPSLQFVTAIGDDADVVANKIKEAIDSVLNIPVTTGTVSLGDIPLTAKWAGESGNQISIEIELDSESGITLVSTDMTGGAVNPDVSTALAKITSVWETDILNLLNYDDTDTLAKYDTWNTGKWTQLQKMPSIIASGVTDDFATRTAITDSRKDDKSNYMIVSVGSRELPFVVAAKGLALIAQTANDTPAKNYTGKLTGLSSGSDSVQENDNTRNLSVQKGSSTNIKVGTSVELNDTITMYHPDDDPNNAYRYVVDIVKLQNIIFNLGIVLASLKGRPLAPDTTVTGDPDAVQPKYVKNILSNLADSLAGGNSMIIVEPKFTKENMKVTINDQNPKRLDVIFPVKISGNVEVVSVDVKWGFYLGN